MATKSQFLDLETSINSGSNLPSMQGEKVGTQMLRNCLQVMIAQYDFAVQGGAIGSVNLLGLDGKAAVLPQNAIIADSLIDVITPCTTSASGTIALTAQSAGDLKAALAAASYTGLVAGIPVGTAATSIKMTADRTLQATIATGAITAGKFNLIVEYYYSA
jgi:hypothetical protein